jgi:hypothetical protein
VSFGVAAGTSIPRHVHLEPLPPRIKEIVPQYKAYRFFILADGRIVNCRSERIHERLHRHRLDGAARQRCAAGL